MLKVLIVINNLKELCLSYKVNICYNQIMQLFWKL